MIFHEACGHLLETTSVAKKASVFHDRMGNMIASPVVSAVDDGTLVGEWGSINVDDEGMATERTQLIRDGKLVGFLADRIGSEQTGHPRTGSGRRQGYAFAPRVAHAQHLHRVRRGPVRGHDRLDRTGHLRGPHGRRLGAARHRRVQLRGHRRLLRRGRPGPVSRQGGDAHQHRSGRSETDIHGRERPGLRIRNVRLGVGCGAGPRSASRPSRSTRFSSAGTP